MRWEMGPGGRCDHPGGQRGNETYQDIMGVKRPFDEKVVVRELLAEMRA